MSSKSRRKKDVERALRKKGFKQRENDHAYFNYYSKEGIKSRVFTKTSHGTKVKDIQGDPLRWMAAQCKLTVDQFLMLVDCPLTRDDYEALLIQNHHITPHH